MTQFKKGDIVRYQDSESTFFVAVTKVPKNGMTDEFQGVVIASVGPAPKVGEKDKIWDVNQFSPTTAILECNQGDATSLIVVAEREHPVITIE